MRSERERVVAEVAELERYRAFLTDDIAILEQHLEQARDALGQLLGGALERAGGLLQQPPLLLDQAHGGRAGDGLDPPHPGLDGALGDDHEGADVAGGAHVGAAAQLHRVAVKRVGLASDLYHTNRIAIFVAKKLQDAFIADHLTIRRLSPTHDGIVDNTLVDQLLDVSQLWRDRVEGMKGEYAAVDVSHLYVDNAAMQLVRDPRQFDVVLTGNLFGDILSDISAMLTGSIGMLPSASLGSEGPGLYEPVHGSAPDLAGQDKANPMAMVLSAAMMLRTGLKQNAAADDLEHAVDRVLAAGFRTGDLMSEGCTSLGCQAMGEELLKTL